MRLTASQFNDSKIRYRNFVSILYPDSAPLDWRDRLTDFHVPAFVSPIHDKDKNPDGTLKKAHYHLLVMFSNVKKASQADEIFKGVGALSGLGSDGKTLFQVCSDIRGQARYFCHLDNPEKAQYSIDDVLSFSGADYTDVIALASDDLLIVDEISRFIRDYEVLSYRQLLAYARDNKPTWFRYLSFRGSRHVFLIQKSAQWEIEHFGRFLEDDVTTRKAAIPPEVKKD